MASSIVAFSCPGPRTSGGNQGCGAHFEIIACAVPAGASAKGLAAGDHNEGVVVALA
jgi:hypothetical protein